MGHMGEFSGSVILILALLIGISLGWFLRGQRKTNVHKDPVRHVLSSEGSKN